MKTSRFIITLPVLVLAAAISTNLSHAQTAASPAPGAGLGTFYNIQMYNCMNGASVTGATANFYNAMFVNMGNCFNNLNYYGARLPVTIGTHTVSSSQPVEVQVYGFGYEDACGYFGGVVK